MAPITGNGVGGSVLSGSVWTGSMAPGVGDTCTFSNGVTYTLASGQTWRVGDATSPSTYAIRTAATAGTAIFNFDGALELLGYVLQGNANWACGAGGSVLFDHATTELTWQISDAHSQHKALVFTGTFSAPCLVSSQAGGANGRFTSGGFQNGGNVRATHTDFLRIGTASNDAFNLDYTFTNANIFVNFTDCTFDACGRVYVPTNIVANCLITLLRVEFKNSLNAKSFRVNGNGGNLGTGTRLLEDVSADNDIELLGYHFTLKEVVVHNTTARRGIIADNPLSMTYIAARINQTSGAAVAMNITPRQAATFKDFYCVGYGASNLHLIQYNLQGLTADQTFDGMIVGSEQTGGQGDGDNIKLQSDPSSLRTVTVRNGIGLPNLAGYSTGCFVAPLTAFQNLHLVGEHNTFVSDSGPEAGFNAQDAAAIAYNGGTPLYTSVKSNLVLKGTRNGASLMTRYNGSVNQQDIADPAQVTHNWIELAASGTFLGGQGDAWSWKQTSTSAYFTVPVAGPTYFGDPKLVDRTRNHLKWDLSLGGAGTGVAAFNRLMKRCSRSNPGVNDKVAHLIAFVRTGYEPTNPLVRAAHDTLNNSTIGAVPMRSTPRLRAQGLLAA